MTKRFAFTLAEVLIALAIIGVVAAMTIPTFMANTAGAQFRTGFKKGITVLTQAASANYATEGYDFGGTNVAYGTRGTNNVVTATATNAMTASLDKGTSRIGFNTVSYANDTDAGKNLDMVSDVQSLFHLFQGNLNMKNSSEIANYDVGLPDVALNCTGSASMTLSVAGVGTKNVSNAKTSADLTSRATANSISGSGATSQAVGGIANLCGGRTATGDGLGGINQGRMFALEDGMVFTYDAGQASCTEGNPCFGYLDVNGAQGPNKVISCSTGDNAYINQYGRAANAELLMATCTVNAKDITDIYPVLFYGSTVKPASLAAKAVLYSQKSNQTESGSGAGSGGEGGEGGEG